MSATSHRLSRCPSAVRRGSGASAHGPARRVRRRQRSGPDTRGPEKRRRACSHRHRCRRWRPRAGPVSGRAGAATRPARPGSSSARHRCAIGDLFPVLGRTSHGWSDVDGPPRRHDRPLMTGSAALRAEATKTPKSATTPTEVRALVQAVPMATACSGTTWTVPSSLTFTTRQRTVCPSGRSTRMRSPGRQPRSGSSTPSGCAPRRARSRPTFGRAAGECLISRHDAVVSTPPSRSSASAVRPRRDGPRPTAGTDAERWPA